MDETVVGIGTFNRVALYRLGATILEEELKYAAMAFVHTYTPAYMVEKINQAVVFMTGSGLEMTIETFCLGYDADRIRESFFELCEKRKKSQTSVS